MNKSIAAWFGIGSAGLLGLILVVAPDVTGDRIPGNLGDARLNNYMLEHGYLWLTGRTESFWNAPFFYPFPLITAFSVNHLGSAPLYSALRLIDFDREDSFKGWYLLGYIANFAACGYALRRLNHGWLGVALGAFLFTFGLPMTAQSGHAQLLYRFGVPLAVLAIIEFTKTPRPAALIALGFWTVWQFYCEIYTGYFLCLLLASFALADAFVQGHAERGILRYWPSRLGTAWRTASVRSRVVFVFAAGALGFALARLFMPYLAVTRLYHFKRSWADIASMLPRFQSYLLSTTSRLWSFSWSGFDRLPMRYEHAMLIGVSPVLAVVMTLTLHWRRRVALPPLFNTVLLAIFFLVVLTLWVDGHSLYRFVAELPGANSIRAVTRIDIVLLFPASMLLASSVDAISSARTAKVVRTGCQVFIAGLLIIECSDVTHDTSLKTAWTSRIQAVADQLPSNLPDAPILFLAPGNEPSFMREIDAMILAQERGWPTLNGYSGNLPPGHILTGTCQDAGANIDAGLDFLGSPGNDAFAQMAKRVVLVGFPECDAAWVTHRPRITNFAGPLPTELMTKTEIAIDSLRIVDNQPIAILTITNHGNLPLPARSSTGMPVRISAQYLPAGRMMAEMIQSVHLNSRQELGIDVQPGQSIRFDVRLPPPPGDGSYIIVVSIVQDGVAWFHDHGMQVAVSDHTIVLQNGLYAVGELAAPKDGP